MKLEGLYCTKCCAWRTGRIYQERYRWMAKLTCGHLSFKGYTMPPAELARLGYVDRDRGPDPHVTYQFREREREYHERRREEDRRRREAWRTRPRYQ